VPILDEGSIDQDEAFAWLESLAVKQGASEALLLAPEERMESMPEWVKQDALAAEAEKEALAVEEEAEAFTEEPAIPEQTISEDETVFDGSPILKAAGAALILDELVEHEPEPAVAEVTEEISEQIPEEVLTEPAISAIEEPLYAVEAAPQELEEIPEVWEETEAAPEELETAEAAFEPAFEAGAESAPLEEEIPELPDWLTETAVAPREELEWTPPPIPQRRYELNEASLSELERIPGIGFITAQNIIIYREENGPFKSVDDLTRIPGITPSTIEGARDYLYVTEAELEISEPVQLEEEPFVLPEAEEISTELVKAREALTQGNLEQALDRYAQMIRTNQELNHIVQDLQEASYRFSDDPSVWQNLGDAYLRQEQVQEALQAYIKAEQLLL
jgi:competence protein ComEA